MLHQTDPDPVITRRPRGSYPLLLTCEHAGRAVPRALGDIGVSQADMDRHIAWDVGALNLAAALSERLDAPLLAQPYSRLVIDCNRPLDAAGLTPTVSDGTRVPANEGLSQAARRARIDAIHTPFHRSIADFIDRRRPAFLVAIHSFTPHMDGRDRPWHAGFLANRMPETARRMMALVSDRAPALPVAYNQPYRIEDETDYTIPVHGEARQLPHVLIEIRNDLLGDEAAIAGWTDLLSDAVRALVAGARP